MIHAYIEYVLYCTYILFVVLNDGTRTWMEQLSSCVLGRLILVFIITISKLHHFKLLLIKIWQFFYLELF